MAINKGDKVKIKDNLEFHLNRLGFDEEDIQPMVKHFVGTEQTAFDIWRDGDELFVTIDMCCEVPIEACEKIEK